MLDPRTRWQRTFESLRVRLAVAAGLVIVACVVTTSQVVLQTVERRSALAVLDLEASNAERMASLVTARLVALQKALGAAASAMPADVVNGNGDLAEAFLRDMVVLPSLFSNVVVARVDGQLLASIDQTGVRKQTRNIADRGYFQKTINEARPVISSPMVGRLSNEAVILLTAPVLDKHGKVQAVLIGGMRLASRTLLDDLTEANVLGTDPVVTFIADIDGRILSHPNPSMVMRSMEEQEGMFGPTQKWSAQGRPIEPTGEAIRMDKHFVASSGVPHADWIVFRVAKEEALLGGVTAARAASGSLAVAVAVGGGLLMLVLLYLALRPLNRLRERALRLSAGAGDELDGWQHPNGELGELSRALQSSLQQRASQEAKNTVLAGQMRGVLAASPMGIVFTKGGVIETSSDEADRLFGFASGALSGRRPRELYVAETDAEAVVKLCIDSFGRGEPVFGEWLMRRHDGSQFWARLNGRPVDSSNLSAGNLWLIEDVTQRRQNRERLSWAATHDALTRLLNRDAFEAALAKALPTVTANDPATLLYIDLDRFKAINDNGGHAAGDQVLQDVAQLLCTHVRGSDVVARLGGDEFAIFLPQCDGPSAHRIAELVREGAQEIGITVQDKRYTIGTSIGLLELHGQAEDAASVLKLADAACYEAKHAGRNAVRVASGAAVIGQGR